MPEAMCLYFLGGERGPGRTGGGGGLEWAFKAPLLLLAAAQRLELRARGIAAGLAPALYCFIHGMLASPSGSFV